VSLISYQHVENMDHECKTRSAVSIGLTS